MTMPRVLVRACLLALLSWPIGHADAQTRPHPRPQARRQQLEQQLRRRLWSVTKARVGLDDAQMARLGTTNARFDVRRRALNEAERAQRQVLRTQILAGAAADQGQVAAALDRILQIQRDRLALQAAEQQELSAFMTPLQRAKYAALQEQVRRRVEALRRGRPDSLPPDLAP